ncbi:MAG: SH3 domain-containing protein [Candidatus Binatia bacterium]
MVAAAAVGASATPGDAENVSARSGEIVAREAPGAGQAGIAVLRGNDRVKLLGQRDGWSEILLSDGRRAWVPTAEIAHVPDAPRPTESHVAVPAASPAPVEIDSNLSDLATEVARLRRVTDDLTTWRTNLPDVAPVTPIPEAVPWAVGGAALAVGILIGALVERRRGRRERSLRF